MGIKHQIVFILTTLWRNRTTSTGPYPLSIPWESGGGGYGGKKEHPGVSSSGREHLAQAERNAGKKQCQSKVKLKVRLRRRN